MTAHVRLAITPRRHRAGAAWLAILLGVLCLLPAAGQALADEANPALQVLEVGWDGHVTTGAWAPVRVKVTGAARDLDGLVEVTLENPYQTSPTTTLRIPMGAYAQEVSLPANASKEVTVWVPTGQGMQATVRLKAGEQELGAEQIEFRVTKAPFWPLVGVLSDQEMLAAHLRRIELPLQNLPTAINVAQLKPEGLPSLPDRLKGLRAMVVQGNTPSKLTDGQRTAIADWVKNGGHLLLAGGPDSALTAGALPAGMLPVTFGGAELNQDLSSLAPWAGQGAAALTGPAVRMQPSGGALLAGTPERPLAWRMNHGNGTITVLAVDPTLEPLASYAGVTPILKKALSTAFFEESLGAEEDRWRMMNMQQEMSYRLRSTLDALPTDAYPDWKQVALYLGGFALLAGPVVHLIFWQGRRRGWVWLAVPVASVVVAGGTYLAGVSMGGRDVMGHTISYLQIDPRSQTAAQMMMIGLYAPMRDEMAVTVDADASINAMGLMENGWRGPMGPEPDVDTRPPFRVVTGRETRMEFFANQWAMRPLSLSRTLGEETGLITSNLRWEEEQIKGTVTNETPYHLEHASVVVGGKVARLGEIAPGQTVEVALEPGQINPFHYMQMGMLFFGEKPSEEFLQRRGPMPPDAPEMLEPPKDLELQRRMGMIESLLYRPKAGPDTPSMPLTFVAFTRDGVGPDVVDLAGHPDHRLTLIEQRLKLELGAGTFRLSPSLIPSEMDMFNNRGMGSSSDGKITAIEIDSGTIVFTYTPPLPEGSIVTALEVTTKLTGPTVPANQGRGNPWGPNMTTQGAEPGIFQIYNFSTGAWEDLQAGQETARLTNVAPYLGDDYQVRVQVNTNNDKVVRFVMPELTVEGRGGQ